MAEIYIGPRFCFGKEAEGEKRCWNGSWEFQDDTGVVWVDIDRRNVAMKEEFNRYSRPTGEYVQTEIFTDKEFLQSRLRKTQSRK